MLIGSLDHVLKMIQLIVMVNRWLWESGWGSQLKVLKEQKQRLLTQIHLLYISILILSTSTESVE